MAAPPEVRALSPDAFSVLLASGLASSGPAQSGGGLGGLMIFNAAMLPGWPFPSALVKDSPALAEPARAALRGLADELSRMSPAEQAEYLAKIGAPFAVLSKLRAILKEIEGIDRALIEGLLLSFLKALGAVADGVAASLSLAESFDRMAVRLAVRDEVGPNEDGRDRLRL